MKNSWYSFAFSVFKKILALVNFFVNLFKYRLKFLSKKEIKTKDRETGKYVTNSENLIKRHGGVLGICAIVNASPYDTLGFVPDCVAHLCQFINDPTPIQVAFIFYILIICNSTKIIIFFISVGRCQKVLERISSHSLRQLGGEQEALYSRTIINSH
jgi:hypothetical protein